MIVSDHEVQIEACVNSAESAIEAERGGADRVELLENLVAAAGERIVVMPGVGIDASNVTDLIQRTGAREVHVLAERHVDSEMVFRNPAVFMGRDPELPEFERPECDREAIRAIVETAARFD